MYLSNCISGRKQLRVLQAVGLSPEGEAGRMTVNTDSVVESLDVFEDKPAGMLVVFNPEPVKPLSLDQRMEGFDTGIVIRIPDPERKKPAVYQ